MRRPLRPARGAPAAPNDELIELHSARMDMAPGADAFVLTADFDVALTPRLEDAVNRGVPLYFRLEVEVSRPRWYWWDQRAASDAIVFRLAYHALTRHYRLTQDGGHPESFGTLHEAVHSMSRVRGWRIPARIPLDPAQTYTVALRMRVDTSQLPKPFQIAALTNRDWNPQSEWKRFAYKPPTQTTSER